MPDPYEVYAIRYAERVGARNQHLLHQDPHDGPMAMDYFVWAIVGNGRTFVVDLGFEAIEAKKRGRTLLRSPAEGLKLLGIDAATVEDVIISHLHYDHAGSVGDFPNAKFYLQDREMSFATGRNMRHETFNIAYSVEYVIDILRKVYDNRVIFIDGMEVLAPGLSVHHVGGHTDGLQIVRVWTKRGWVVLAADAAHYYENMETPNPFPLVYNVGDMIDGYRTMALLAESPQHIVPGHDPLVTKRYPALSPETEGIIVRLDAAPSA
ncbi:MAG: N-acyl homoserine lactonase family protein [Pseudomonadales bacterium]|nr:N-acyl homoserine lactonase family protein [Pseudomonadales bacterium]